VISELVAEDTTQTKNNMQSHTAETTQKINQVSHNTLQAVNTNTNTNANTNANANEENMSTNDSTIQYILNSLKNIFSISNIGMLIWMIANVTFIVWFFHLIWSPPRNYIYGILIYLISVIMALSPVGEWLLRFMNHAEEMTEEVKSKLMPLWNNVYNKAKEKNPNLPHDVKFYIINDGEVNAFATGRKTVCVNDGLLECLSDDEIEAVLSHELGHLSYCHTYVSLIIVCGNIIVNILFWFIRLLNDLFTLFCTWVTESCFAYVLGFIKDFIFGGIVYVWNKIGIILCNHTSRVNEYEADKFAWELGYGKKLIDALRKLSGSAEVKNLQTAIMSTHPYTSDRIERLESYDRPSISENTTT
jgi:heat shock protein HtpX